MDIEDNQVMEIPTLAVPAKAAITELPSSIGQQPDSGMKKSGEKASKEMIEGFAAALLTADRHIEKEKNPAKADNPEPEGKDSSAKERHPAEEQKDTAMKGNEGAVSVNPLALLQEIPQQITETGTGTKAAEESGTAAVLRTAITETVPVKSAVSTQMAWLEEARGVTHERTEPSKDSGQKTREGSINPDHPKTTEAEKALPKTPETEKLSPELPEQPKISTASKQKREVDSPIPPDQAEAKGNGIQANAFEKEPTHTGTVRVAMGERPAFQSVQHGDREGIKDAPSKLERTEVKAEVPFSQTGAAKGDLPSSVQKGQAPSAVSEIRENTFVISKKSESSLQVTVEPSGLGKLDIRLDLDKGMIHARINAADITAKEAIERNLDGIAAALAKEGLNIGGLSVSLNNYRDQGYAAPGASKGEHQDGQQNDDQQKQAANQEHGIISIFI